jgi:hypothetical protein
MTATAVVMPLPASAVGRFITASNVAPFFVGVVSDTQRRFATSLRVVATFDGRVVATPAFIDARVVTLGDPVNGLLHVGKRQIQVSIKELDLVDAGFVDFENDVSPDCTARGFASFAL